MKNKKKDKKKDDKKKDPKVRDPRKKKTLRMKVKVGLIMAYVNSEVV